MKQSNEIITLINSEKDIEDFLQEYNKKFGKPSVKLTFYEVYSDFINALDEVLDGKPYEKDCNVLIFGDRSDGVAKDVMLCVYHHKKRIRKIVKQIVTELASKFSDTVFRVHVNKFSIENI